jgi:hypothetical protein
MPKEVYMLDPASPLMVSCSGTEPEAHAPSAAPDVENAAAVAAGVVEAEAAAAEAEAETELPPIEDPDTDGLGLDEGVGKLEPPPVFGVPQICTMGLQ